MNIAMSFNKKYIDYAIVSLTSLFENNKTHFDVNILQDELGEDDFSYINEALHSYDFSLVPLRVAISKDIINFLPMMEYWSKEIYFRLFLPELLPPQVDRILYLDTDVIIHKSIVEFYESDFEGMDIIASPDSNGTTTKDMLSEKQLKMLGEYLDKGHVYLIPV